MKEEKIKHELTVWVSRYSIVALITFLPGQGLCVWGVATLIEAWEETQCFTVKQIVFSFLYALITFVLLMLGIGTFNIHCDKYCLGCLAKRNRSTYLGY